MATTVATSIPEIQMEVVRERFPESSVTLNPDGSWTVNIHNVALDAQRWNQPSTTVRFILPVGYPAARPDCFFADATLRLVAGNMPAGTGIQPLPHSGAQHLWFSWHLDYWNPARDSILTFIRVMQVRLATGQ
jgi:hypothetical protein